MKLSTLVLSYKLASCLLEMERWWGGGGGKEGVLGKGTGCHRFTDVRKGDDFGRILIPDIHD